MVQIVFNGLPTSNADFVLNIRWYLAIPYGFAFLGLAHGSKYVIQFNV